jgi:hypothetical protein
MLKSNKLSDQIRSPQLITVTETLTHNNIVARCFPVAATIQVSGVIYFWHQPVKNPGVHDS